MGPAAERACSMVSPGLSLATIWNPQHRGLIERAAGGERPGERRKKCAGYDRRIDDFRSGLSRERLTTDRIKRGRRNRVERCVPVVELSGLHGRGHRPACARQIDFAADEQQLTGVAVGKRPQKHTVHHAEHGDVCADAEGQRQHRCERKRRVFCEQPQRIADVLLQVMHKAHFITSDV